MKDNLKRVFKIWAYTVSHNFLILRSTMKFTDQEDYSELYDFNIDIEFIAVAFFEMPCILNGIEINELTENIPSKFIHFKKDLGSI